MEMSATISIVKRAGCEQYGALSKEEGEISWMDGHDGQRLLRSWVEMRMLFCEDRRETDRAGGRVEGWG